MSRTLRLLLGVLIAAMLATAIGCGEGSNSGRSRAADTRTPGQYFRDRQASTMTPNGKILMNSVEERPGEIEYKTEDGKRWRVTYSKRADGTYQYGTPDEIK